MTVKAILESKGNNVVTIEPTASLAAVVKILADRRIGALVVIEQQTGLREYVESGTALDARLSLELLLAVFNKTSPLHDGVVAVRDLVVEGAGCFLPLSENLLPIDRHVGTRHRAAGGLTEQTYAVVVVVSEESGLISVARAGRLSVPIDDEERLSRVLAACIRPTRRRTQADGGLLANLLTRVSRAQRSGEQLRT